MGWAATHKVVLGSLAFLVFWLLAVFPAVPLLPIGRTAGSILGACLMVVFQVITPRQAFDAVDLPILGLLFGTMVVSIYLERADLFKYLGSALTWKSRGGRDLLCRVCLLSAVTSALFTNDTTCVVFTGFVLRLCHTHGLPVQPFLMALATSSNIGSAATAIGNPQNLVIAVQSRISFFKFLVGMLPAVTVGILVNTILLLGFYWRDLRPPAQVQDPKEDQEDHPNKFNGETTLPGGPQEDNSQQVDLEAGIATSVIEVEEHTPRELDDLLRLEVGGSMDNHMNSSRASSLSRSLSRSVTVTKEDDDQHHVLSKQVRRKLWKSSVYIVTLGMLAALLYGLDLSWSALTAAVALMALTFSDASPSLDQVSYSLLVFFSGMFITVDGFNRTGAPGQLWKAVEPHARINSASGVTLLSLVVLLLSNVASNVPTVLLLGARVAASAALTHGASVSRAWLLLAWVSTVAGNLTLVGSAANLIVSEQARRAEAPFRHNLSFWSHLKFGLPSTFIVIAVGLPLV